MPVVDHWSRDKHDVYTYITNETLHDLKLEGAAYVPNDTPTVTKMFRCKSKGCTRIQCARYTRIKLSSAITRVVRAKGPWSLMLTIPRLTDEELKKPTKSHKTSPAPTRHHRRPHLLGSHSNRGIPFLRNH